VAAIYNVLLADDEAVMRIAFSKMLDWDASEFRLAAAVSNGAEALAYIRENHVDIVVTDLIMPVMDGLDLIQALKDDGFGGVILVLSNFSDFELVRSALTRGAADYMLKLDIDGEALAKQLNAAAAMIGERNTPKAPRGDSFYPCLLSVRHKTGQADTYDPALRAMVVIKQMFAETGAEIELMGRFEAFLLIPGQGRGDTFEWVMDKLRQIVRQIQIYLNLNVRALLSRKTAPFEQASGMYPVFEKASSVFFYPSIPEVRCLEDVSFVSHAKEPDPHDAAFRYVSIYYRQGGSQAEGYFSELMERFAALPANPSKAKEFFLAALRVIDFAFPSGADPRAKGEGSSVDAASADAFIAGLCGRLSGILDRASPGLFRQYGEYRKEVRDALLFIHFHYQDKITLDDVAGAVNLNRDYLCRLFKQETSSGMFRHINSLRMQRAASLIIADKGSSYMREVAASVGIGDQFYFARVFKKYHGVSPSEYAKRLPGAEAPQ